MREEGSRSAGRKERKLGGKSGVHKGETGRNRRGEEGAKGSLTDPFLILRRFPSCDPAAWFPRGPPLWRPAPHTLSAGSGRISSFSFVLSPSKKWLQMLWVGHSLAVLTVPRCLMIPGDRAGTSNQPQRGAELCSRAPHTLGNPSLVLGHPSPLDPSPASREMLWPFSVKQAGREALAQGRLPETQDRTGTWLAVAWGDETCSTTLPAL